MKTVRFWAAIILGVVLGALGFVTAGVLPLPEPTTLNQTRFLYTSLGLLTSVLVFARVTQWLVRTTTSLARQLVLRLATEIINQLGHLTSASIPFLTGSKPAVLDERMMDPIVVDTSAIIDGRIVDVAKSGFLSGVLLVPNFVLIELQQVADSADDLKRARGRRGFDIIELLKKTDGVKLQIWDEQSQSSKEILKNRSLAGKSVDEKLVSLAKLYKGRVFTCDFNLNRVAKVSGVAVMNLNDLVNALKNLPVPGESLAVKIIHQGKDKTQGVGYLSDGTMVVVKQGAHLVGEKIDVEVSKTLQGPAGRMIFGSILTPNKLSTDKF